MPSPTRSSPTSPPRRRPPWAAHEVTAVGPYEVHAAAAGPDGAPEVVAVHGLGCSHRYWGRLAATLAPGTRLVAPDLPGFGWTPGPRRALAVDALADVLGAWLDATGRLGAPVVANSAGCQVVAALAARRSGAVGPAVLVGPTLDPTAPGLARQLARLLADVPHERPDLWWTQAVDYLRCGPRRLLGTFRHMARDPVEDDIAALDGPVVVLRGEHDPVVSPAWARRLSQVAPRARCEEVPRSGHAVHHRRPEAVAAALADVRAALGAERTHRATVRACA